MGIYYEDNNIFYQEGNIPVVMTFPHSGLSLIDGVEVRKKGIIDGDCFTDLFANYMVQMFNCIGCNCCMKDVDNCGGCTDATACCCDSVAGIPDYNTFEFNSQCLRPFIIYSKIDRKHCDFNRAKEVAYEDQRLADIYDQYHRTINDAIADRRAQSARLHSQSWHSRVSNTGATGIRQQPKANRITEILKATARSIPGASTLQRWLHSSQLLTETTNQLYTT
ncbi:hypothetical protein PPL_06766 [Heterostelium album PN500]|uniref:Uncharacterized protein n=1 Tax=Heterostelium pallidum (strain ATCC 26659 / Pp 5 / PN500) TaxID=670386 RepID=D3BFN1_HETP5|nr:hypothetical protein PPL_06766 [Heterostelium album PN500]EFA79945.1 hypothetical protein PPL_06766 [Heterostelium album PN500]|eukprot:XP_020432065.1 hypothetical protein PPL_06766 [Heterostelium album PN500]